MATIEERNKEQGISYLICHMVPQGYFGKVKNKRVTEFYLTHDEAKEETLDYIEDELLESYITGKDGE